MAARYFINGGVNANWSTSGNWSATDGGAASGVKPSASDDVFFTGNSPACTVDTAGVGLTINFTGYTNTITMTAGLTISGSVTLVAAMTIAGASGLTVSAASTLTSNTKVWPNALTLNAGVTYTLADNWNVDGLLTIGVGSSTTTVNGFQINAGAGFTVGGSSSSSTGTTVIVMDGTGTITATTTFIKNSLTINTAGTITFAAAVCNYSTGTLTYTAGTVVTTGSTLTVALSATLSVSGITWNNVSFLLGSGNTCTLAENMTVLGRLSLGITTSFSVVNGGTITVSGGLRHSGTTGIISGTTQLVANATSTLDGPSTTTGSIDLPITIDANGGTVTIDNVFKTILYKFLLTAGTVVTDAGTWASGGNQCFIPMG